MPTPSGPHHRQPGAPIDPADAEDRALMARLRGPAGFRDPNALEALLRRHQDRLYATCLRMVGRNDAADVCQTAMVRIVQGLSGFDERARFSTWATRVAINACLSHVRSGRIRKAQSLPESGDVYEPQTRHREPQADSGVQESAEARRLRRALDRLDGEQRAILVLRDVRGLDYAQIAEVLGVAEGTVKSRLFRAREALRIAMIEDERHT